MASSFNKLQNLSKKLISLATKAVADEKLANRMKNKILLEIKKNSTLPSGAQVKDVSFAWKKYRSNLSSVNRTSKYFGQNKSNMTFTGQFLDSFVAFLKLAGRAVKFEMFVIGTHKGYNLLEGDKSNDVLNKDIALGFIARGDDYRQVSPQVKQDLAKMVKARILKEFKLNL